MGLDMYVYLEKYKSYGKWKDDFESKKDTFYPEELKELAENIQEQNFMSKTTRYQVGYWRKANAIHNWFVNKCAGGEDNCQDIYVLEEELKELKEICEVVLKDHSKAKALLPTTSGFFFGSQEYDEDYFKDLEYTINLINKILKVSENHNYNIVYQASW